MSLWSGVACTFKDYRNTRWAERAGDWNLLSQITKALDAGKTCSSVVQIESVGHLICRSTAVVNS